MIWRAILSEGDSAPLKRYNTVMTAKCLTSSAKIFDRDAWIAGRVGLRRDGNFVVRFEKQYVRIDRMSPVTQTAAKTAMPPQGEEAAPVVTKVHGKSKSKWMKGCGSAGPR